MYFYDDNHICAIDIGNNGAICLYNIKEPKRLHIYDMTVKTRKVGKKVRTEIDFIKALGILNDYRITDLYMEDITTIFGVHKHTSFIMGYQKGVFTGYTISHDIMLHLVRPRDWQERIFRTYGYIDWTKDDTKKLSVETSNKIIKEGIDIIYIKDSNQEQLKEIKKSWDGIADAICIMQYALITNKLQTQHYGIYNI